MDLAGKAKRVRIYLKESDRIGRKPAPYAVIDWLRREGAAGATSFRGSAGVGSSGRFDTDVLPEIGPHLPVVVEWIDSAERVQRLLPRLQELVGPGLITCDDTDVVFYRPHGLRDLPVKVTVGEVMSRDVASVSPATPLRRVVELVEGKIYRAVPVVEDGRPVGIITNLDLVERGKLLARIELLGSLGRTERASALDQLDRERKTARDVMTPDPVTIGATASLPAVAGLMAHERLKRLPVVDEDGKLVGIVSRLDLLKTVAEAPPAGPDEVRASGLRGDLPLSRAMRKDVPAVHPETPLGEVLQAIVSTRLNRALVVDADKRVLGVVTDEEVLDRVTPAMRASIVRALVHRLPFSNVAKAEIEAEHHARARTAADLMTTDVAIAREDQLLRDAIAPMTRAPHKIVAVVDREGRLVGAVDRADILRGLVPS